MDISSVTHLQEELNVSFHCQQSLINLVTHGFKEVKAVDAVILSKHARLHQG